jgi:hypothetical protein
MNNRPESGLFPTELLDNLQGGVGNMGHIGIDPGPAWSSQDRQAQPDLQVEAGAIQALDCAGHRNAPFAA